MVEVGGGVALGDSMFAFNLELRAVAWETKPQKKKSHFCMHLQMAGRAFVLKASPLSLKAQRGQVYDLPNPPEHSTDTVYHGANQIEHAYVRNGDKKVNMLFSGPMS